LYRIFTLALTLVLILSPTVAAEVPKEVRDRGVAATVRVEDRADSTGGSGVLIALKASHSYVLTAQHVVPKAEKVEVTTAFSKPVKAEVLARSAEVDLAILRFPAADRPLPVSLAVVGTTPDQVISAGWESGRESTDLAEELKGKVRLRRPGASNAVLCWEVARRPTNGRSGGPLMDQAGRIIGIASGHDGTVGYYVHVDEIHAFLRANALGWLTEDEH